MGTDYRSNQFSLPENMSVAMVIVHHNKDLSRALCQTLQLFQSNLPAFKLAAGTGCIIWFVFSKILKGTLVKEPYGAP